MAPSRPTQQVARASTARPLTPGRPLDPGEVDLVDVDGAHASLADVLARTSTDAVTVVHDGVVVLEEHAGTPGSLHPAMSVTKSVVGCVAGIAIGRRELQAADEVVRFVPELRTSGYAGATVRDLLDMRSGVAFREAYDDASSDSSELERWIVDPSRRADGLGGIYGYLTTVEADRAHGTRFDYRSCETDALGWVLERATGAPMPQLLEELVWQPMGAEHDAVMTLDVDGVAVHDGGLLASARDLARFGLLLLDGGRAGAVDVVPPGWLTRGWAVDADSRAAFAASPAEQQFPGGWYRDQLWVRPGPYGDVMLCLGIHGQMVHVNRRTRTVCVKLSSWPRAQDPRALLDTVRAFDEVGAQLSGVSTRLKETTWRLV